MGYYDVKQMDSPTLEMYGISSADKILMIGCAKKYTWAYTVDIDPCSPADMIADGAHLPFGNKSFDVCILDFTTNFMPPSKVGIVIKEANRVARKVLGRCHVAQDGRTLRGAKQAFCHRVPPNGVEWIECRQA